MRRYLSRARAFLFPSEEDFGIVPVEAQACGTPVIAFGSGGALETVSPPGRPGLAPTGLFFFAQTAESLAAAVHRFEQECSLFDPQAIHLRAQRFSRQSFRQRLMDTVSHALTAQHAFAGGHGSQRNA